MNNYEKNEKYADLMGRLKEAINRDFYYEAIFIEYAILEDRTESLLKHAKLSLTDYNGVPLNLNSKLQKIKHSVIFYKDEYINKHFTYNLISDIHMWKNRRNELIHDLIRTKYNNEDIKQIALDGYEIVKVANNKSRLVTKYLDKKKGEVYVSN